jgi:hypothetical protein
MTGPLVQLTLQTAGALLDVVVHSFRDTLPMVPFLLVLYTGLEMLSHRQGFRLLLRSNVPRAFGPMAGALLGIIPQCGMSVFITSLFLGGRVTAGTLVATYLATSDEALPVLLAHSQQVGTIVRIVSIKIVVGFVAGLIVDVVARRPSAETAGSAGRSWIQLHVENEMHAAPLGRALLHGLRRTVEVFSWVLLITVVLGLVIDAIGLARIAAGTRRHPVLELIGATLLGSIPNCSASIAIAEGYIRGVLSFSATVAGLCAGAGYGPILLLRRGLLPTGLRLLGTCLVFSFFAGVVVAALARW